MPRASTFWTSALSGATSKRSIPLPATLEGVSEERCIIIDAALFYLVSGALLSMLDESLYQTGTLTVEDARTLLEQSFWDFMND